MIIWYLIAFICVVCFLFMGIIKLCNYVILIIGFIIIVIAILRISLRSIVKIWRSIFKKNSGNVTQNVDYSKLFDKFWSYFMEEMIIYTKKPLLFAILFILFALIAFFVWPTMYRYDHMIFNRNNLLVRINRLTGNTEVLSGTGGWISLDANHPSKETTTEQNVNKSLSQDELIKLDGNLTITNYGWIEANIYNGNEKKLESIIVQVTVYRKDGNVELSRKYKLTSTDGRPLKSTKYIVEAGISLYSGQNYDWKIIGAEYE
jgi:hypothetical protein